MNFSKILVICKLSKIEYDKIKLKLSISELIKKYKNEQIYYKNVLESHTEQQNCIKLVKKLLPQASFIKIFELNKNLTKNKDLIISVGGDEHFKSVIHKSCQDKFFLNVRSNNLKSEGVLSSCNRLNFKTMLEQIKKNIYDIEHWVKLKATLNGKKIVNSIDTIFIGERNATRMSKYIIEINNKKEEQKSSGIIVVTGTGSTGWFKSAGGDVFDRQEEKALFLVREIYRGKHTGYTIKKGSLFKDKIIIIHSLNRNGIIEIDSTKKYPFKNGNLIKISLCKKRLKVITFKKN